MTITFVSESDVINTISMKESLDVIENAFKQFALGKSKMPSKVYIDLPEYNGDFRAMPAYDYSQELVGVKWVNVHTKNNNIGLPTVMASIVLNDSKTGKPTAFLEAGALTAIRTGAAGGIAIKYLSSKDASVASIIGTGTQAQYQIEAMLLTRDIKKIKLFDLNKDKAETLKKTIEPIFKGEIEISNSIQECVNHACIVITLTPSKEPILKVEWLSDHVHINAIGADAEGKRECDDAIIKSAQLIIDDWDQASHSGEINVPIQSGLISSQDITATLGEIICQNKIVDQHKMTLFDSTGLAIQDIALAGYIYKKLQH